MGIQDLMIIRRYCLHLVYYKYMFDLYVYNNIKKCVGATWVTKLIFDDESFYVIQSQTKIILIIIILGLSDKLYLHRSFL